MFWFRTYHILILKVDTLIWLFEEKKHTMNVIMVYILNLIQKCVLEVRRQIEISKMPMLLISVHWKIGTVSPFRKKWAMRTTYKNDQCWAHRDPWLLFICFLWNTLTKYSFNRLWTVGVLFMLLKTGQLTLHKYVFLKDKSDFDISGHWRKSHLTEFWL